MERVKTRGILMKQRSAYALTITGCLIWIALTVMPPQLQAQQTFDLKANYAKSEHTIAMRDGVKLFVAVYSPRDTSQKYPILLSRTPYSCGPYGPDAYKETIG